MIQVFYGLIADGIHTHPTALRMAVRSNMDGLVAVSDAIGAMGLTDGKYNLGQYQIEVKGPRAVIAGIVIGIYVSSTYFKVHSEGERTEVQILGLM